MNRLPFSRAFPGHKRILKTDFVAYSLATSKFNVGNTATLLISEDLDEVMALSDRIVVMFGGEIMGIVENKDISAGDLGLMMAGERIETNN